MVTAEVMTTGSDGAVVTSGVEEENVPRLPEAVVPLLPVALVALVVGTAVGAADASVPAATLLPAGTSSPVGGLEVGRNCVGANDVVIGRDAVGEGITLLVSTRDVRFMGSTGGRAVWVLPSLPEVKSSVGLIVAPISSSKAGAVDSKDEDIFKTGVAGKVVNKEIRFVSLSKTLLVTEWVSDAGSTRVGTTEWEVESKGSTREVAPVTAEVNTTSEPAAKTEGASRNRDDSE